MNRIALFIFFVVAVSTRQIGLAQESVVPILASSPHVLLSLTDQRDPDDANWFSIVSDTIGGDQLPRESSTPHLEVAIYDTGAPLTIIGNDAFQNFDIQGAGRGGINVTQIGGVGDPVDAINSDPLGVYVAGFDAVLQNDPAIADTSQFKGSYNDSIVYAPDGVALPNLIGTTTSARYTTKIDYGEPQIAEINGTQYRSPAVSLHELGSLERPARRIQLTIEPAQLPGFTFLPDTGNLDISDLGNNPSIPTIGPPFSMRTRVTNNGVVRDQLSMIFDTGAQGTFVSEQIASEMGFDVENDEPDFVVRVAGVTGESEEVKGFIADEFFIPGTDGGLMLTNVPLVVFNLTDPRDGVNTLDGLIGMNLFADRDLVLNPEPGNSYLGVSDPVLTEHRWASTLERDAWEVPGNWTDMGAPNAIWEAILKNNTGAAQSAVVSSDSSISSLLASGQAGGGTMTIEIDPGATLELFGTAVLQEHSIVRLNDSRLATVSVEMRGGELHGTGDVEGEVLSQGVMVPGGKDAIGQLRFAGSFDQLAQGSMLIEIAGPDNSDPANPQYDRVSAVGDTTLGGLLSVETTDDYLSPMAGGGSFDFALLEAASIIESFDEIQFNGLTLDTEFNLPGDERSFRDHVGSGQFIWISLLDLGETQQFLLSDYRALAGDADGDGIVQFTDFIQLSANFGATGDWTQGDFSGDGMVQFADFALLAGNFGTEAFAPAAASIPEPSASLLSGLAVLFLGAARRRRFPTAAAAT